MAGAQDLRRLALFFAGAEERPHFDRAAFRIDRNFATLAPDGLTANLKLTPDEQALKCELAPHGFAPVPNAWGAQGWTTVTLAAVSVKELEAALAMAAAHASGKARRRRA